jgi:hypothetical protein
MRKHEQERTVDRFEKVPSNEPASGISQTR